LRFKAIDARKLARLLLPLNGCVRKEPDMNPPPVTWMVDSALVGTAMPPRDPNDDDDEDEEDEEDEDKHDEPAVIREPDEDQ
jgi:hypothetical protein